MTQQAPDRPAGPTITVHPHGELTSYFGRSYGGVPVPIEPGITIAGLLERLGVPAKEVWLVAKNGEQVQREDIVRRMSRLTQRECEVMERVADGKPNKVIAEELGLSPKTVEVHRARLMHKLEVDSLAQLMRIAILRERYTRQS